MWEFCEVTLGTSFPDGERTMLTMKNQTKIPPTFIYHICGDGCACYGVHVGVRGQLVRVVSPMWVLEMGPRFSGLCL